MAISRLLYSSQTALITVGGRLEGPTTFVFNPNDSEAVKSGKDHTGAGPHNASGFTSVMPYLLPVQSVSVDQTVPQEDVIVMGNLGGVARIQKDVATSKCTIKSYLAEYMSFYDGVVLVKDTGLKPPAQSGMASANRKVGRTQVPRQRKAKALTRLAEYFQLQYHCNTEQKNKDRFPVSLIRVS